MTAGEALVTRLQAFRSAGVHVLGSFIFGLPTDTPDTFAATADLAQKADLSFAQFVMLTPFPGTVDFATWERESTSPPTIGGVPLTQVLADSSFSTAQSLLTASDDVGGGNPDAHPTSLGPVLRLPSSLAAVAVCPFSPVTTGLCPDLASLPTDVREHGHRDRQRTRGTLCATSPMACQAVRRMFVAAPMPDLQEPRAQTNSGGKRFAVAVVP